MANQPTQVKPPLRVTRAGGNLNDGQAYERKLLLLIAASLSQNKDVKDFGIVSNPKGINKIDDVVVRIFFEESSGKEDIALFVQSKHTESERKVLWLNFEPKEKRKDTNKVEINLSDYEREFENVTKIMSSNEADTKGLRELLNGVDEEHYFVWIFTNMRKYGCSDSKFKLLPKEFDKDDPMLNCLDTGVECAGGRYHQFDRNNNTTLDKNFYRQLFIFLGQPSFKEIDFNITNILGKDFKNALVNLDGTLKEFMQRADMCYVLTKAEFEVHCLKVMLDKWLRVDVGQVVEINPKFMPVWYKILSHQAVINLGDNKTWPLFANYYQWVIHEKEHNQTVAELLFSLWRDNKIPLPIKSDYTQNILGFLKKFKTINNSFIIFCGKDTPELNDYRSPVSVITYVREISDEETLSEMSNIQVSLGGRPPVSLAEIAGVPLETAKEGMYKDLTMSQVLAWTENSKTHIIGSPLPAPDVKKYITRNFTQKGEEQNKLTEKAVLEFNGAGLHLITGEPGLGKSTVLEALAHSYTPQNFIIYIKLRDCLDDIENRSIWPSIQDDPIKYFFSKMPSNTDDKITISIMETHKISQRLCLFLDGFDEILPLHGSRISSLMAIILNNTDVRICCTTRPHAENKIKISADRTICFKLLQFDYEQINEYFAKTNLNNDFIRLFGLKFLGNPLHLDMLSQINVDKEHRDGITIGEMYKLFIKLKHDIYNKRRGLSQNDAHIHNRISMKNHRLLAMVDIFGKECVTSKGLIPHAELDKIITDIGDQNIGIVQRNRNGFQFVHRTFAEYFVAEWLLHNIVQGVSNIKVLKHFHKKVWFGEAYANIKNTMKELTRNFDLWLEAIRFFFINSDNENKSSTCSCNGYIGWLECPISHPNVNGSTIVNSINREYPTRRPLDVEEIDTCTKLLTAIHAENEEHIERNLSRSLLNTGVGVMAFNLAITTGNESIVKILLDLRPTLVNEQDVNGNTGLHISCAFGYTSIAALLFEQSANSGIVNKIGVTPLGMATENEQWGIWMMKNIGEISKRSGEHGYTSADYQNISNDLSKALLIASDNFKWEIVKQLVEYGADPTLSDKDGWTAMHFAARGRDLKVIDILSESGCDVNKRTDSGKTPVAIACGKGESDIVKRLLELGADPTLSDEDGWTPTHFAANRGDLKIFEMLLERGLNINVKTNDGQTPLAIVQNELKCMVNQRYLCDDFTSSDSSLESDDILSFDDDDTWPLSKTIEEFSEIDPIAMKFNMIMWLLEHGADPPLSGQYGWTLTHFAAIRGDLKLLETLSEKGLNINAKTNSGKTPLMIACDTKKADTVQWLLEHGADPTLPNKDGWTSTHIAAESGDIQILEMFSERQFNVNAKTNDGRTPLAIACEADKSNTVKWLLEHVADPTLPDKNGWTSTHFAALEGNLQVIEMLSERGHNINVETNNGITPLTIACHRKKSDIVKLLLEHGADPTLPDKIGWTLTHFAAERGDLKLLEMLSERGLNINAKNSNGKTPLAIACDAMKSDTVKWLLAYGADPTLSDNDGWAPMHFTSMRGELQIIEMLLERGLNINVKTNDGKTPLVIACAARKSDTVKWLLEHGADPTLSDNDGRAPMHFTSMQGELQIFEMLLERGVNINVKTNYGNTPLAIACDARKSDTVKWLLQHGATLSDNAGWTATHVAAHSGDLEILEILTETGLNINVKTNDGKTPLIIAADAKKSDTVKWLLKYGADTSLSDEAGWTPMHFSAQRGDLQSISMLTERGLNINKTANDGITPLIIACVEKKWETVEWLLEHGANPTQSDNNGWTPLHFAANKPVGRPPVRWASNQLSAMKMLLEKGLNVNERNHHGQTPLAIARSTSWTDMVELLLEHGSDGI